MTPGQEAQKERARKEAEHHQENSNVTGQRDVERRFKSKTEMLGEDLVKDAAKEGLRMEIE